MEPVKAICEFFATNPALAISIVSAITAIVSTVIAYSVYRSNIDPYVVAYLHQEGQSLYLVVENIGSSPAIDVKFEMSGSLARGETFERFFGKSFVAKDIQVLMPGYMLKTAVGLVGDYPSETSDPPKIEVSFRRVGAKLFGAIKFEYALDWSQFRNLVYADSSRQKMEDALRKAAEAHTGYLKERSKVDACEMEVLRKILEEERPGRRASSS